jgi:hypothetical protein
MNSFDLTSIGLNHPALIELIQSTTKNRIDHATDSQLGRTALADSIPELITLLQNPDLDVVQAALALAWATDRIEALGHATLTEFSPEDQKVSRPCAKRRHPGLLNLPIDR